MGGSSDGWSCWVLGAGCWVLGAGCWVLDRDAAAHEERPPGEPGGLGACSQSVLRQLGGRRDGCLCAKVANAFVPVAYQMAEMVTSARAATGAVAAVIAEERIVVAGVNMASTEPCR